MANRRNSHFRKGSGIYTCESCGKRTRETGGSESFCGLCAACYDYAGWENSHSDDGHENTEWGTGPNPNCPICQGKPDPAREAPSGEPTLVAHTENDQAPHDHGFGCYGPCCM